MIIHNSINLGNNGKLSYQSATIKIFVHRLHRTEEEYTKKL